MADGVVLHRKPEGVTPASRRPSSAGARLADVLARARRQGPAHRTGSGPGGTALARKLLGEFCARQLERAVVEHRTPLPVSAARVPAGSADGVVAQRKPEGVTRRRTS
ncbi:hypothetical protein GCM10022267_73310 [Lentzea roselyniae]|uniref:Uncharacterized protein n=1 Tax=Lentzea roselyniae TaxID=531940 RepID=A0ABP7C324_9PSEU